MRCVECGARVDSLYTEYSKDNFRLTQCPACLRFADKYIEFDYVILTIDVMLLKPQVYRHLLFNSLARKDERIDPSVARLGLLLVLFDVCKNSRRIWRVCLLTLLPDLTWYRFEKRPHSQDGTIELGFFNEQSIVKQYSYFLALSLLETVVFHISARLLSRFMLGARRASWSMISTALFRQFADQEGAKLVPVFMVIWEYDIPEAAVLIEWVVVIYNIEATRSMQCKSELSYAKAVSSA
ncbi:Protein arv1 [Taphrina deformans PYCC 5710]|uniref:Protein ARV n=1 Tax=Taphrina deformans (strain PYCC 5710 / ATCC 11124 / CBS 356.35 / IMI 108563 / JCM 9778 / NBRC 8474) TaxID=1097556 RepID=R4X7X5_TAPDE|nr:Protein arv1 [Taphrina deformans PYCC 5710]|eukprot:CCG81540.1 Protein arv1 [Taphrina deformans PYCC 5710]